MNPMLAMLNGWEIVMILAIVLILFGSKKLPELARGLGQGIKEFKKASHDVQAEIESAMDMDSPPPAPRKLPTETQPRTPEATPETTPTPEAAPQHSAQSQS